jgi:hypothetical protein
LTQAATLIGRDLVAESTPQLKEAWTESIAAITAALTKLDHDVSITKAMADPATMGRALDAVVRLGGLVDLTDALLASGDLPRRSWLGRPYALGSVDHPIDWAGDALDVLQTISTMILDPEVEIAADPFEARFAQDRQREAAMADA